MYDEDDLLPISALQHLAFCERQWGLIHIEQLWDENRLTAEGRILHDQADSPETESRGDVRIARSLRLRSLRLGLSGKADVVEFHRVTREEPLAPSGVSDAVALEGVSGLWSPFPVEYKRGRPKAGDCDKVQLCAQALCLEDMLSVVIPAGALFYGKPRRRQDVMFDEALRAETEALAARLHELTRTAKTPPAVYAKKCENCSLLECCLPKAATQGHSAKTYLAQALANMEKDSP